MIFYNYFTTFSFIIFLTFFLFFIKFPHRSHFYLRLVIALAVGYGLTTLLNFVFPQEGFVFDLSSFSRCSASTLVNLMFVREIKGNDVILNTGEVLPIGRTKKLSFISDYASYKGGLL